MNRLIVLSSRVFRACRICSRYLVTKWRQGKGKIIVTAS
jgi:hypothetical protein